jgi:hypothetical protein
MELTSPSLGVAQPPLKTAPAASKKTRKNRRIVTVLSE